MSKRKFFKDNTEWFKAANIEHVGVCMICGKGYDNSSEDHISVCSSCGFTWRISQPTQEVLDEFYADSNPVKQWAEIKSTLFESERQKDKFNFFFDYANRSHSVLDVGCGNGFFLNNLDACVGKVGIELSDDAADRCKFPVYRDYETFKDSAHAFKYQMITLFGVMEHLKDPQVEIEKYAEFLEENGTIGIIVPNVDSLVVKVLKDECCTFCPQHLWYYNIKSLSALMKKAGFELLSWGTREPELQPILKKMKGLDPYLKLGFDLTDKDITENKIIDNGLGYKVCALYRRIK